jgi:hypothetical protein
MTLYTSRIFEHSHAFRVFCNIFRQSSTGHSTPLGVTARRIVCVNRASSCLGGTQKNAVSYRGRCL